MVDRRPDFYLSTDKRPCSLPTLFWVHPESGMKLCRKKRRAPLTAFNPVGVLSYSVGPVEPRRRRAGAAAALQMLL